MPSQSSTLRVDGQPVHTDATFQVINPATEEVVAEVPEVDAASVQRSLASAQNAFPAWSKTPLAQRKTIIGRYTELLEAKAQEKDGYLHTKNQIEGVAHFSIESTARCTTAAICTRPPVCLPWWRSALAPQNGRPSASGVW